MLKFFLDSLAFALYLAIGLVSFVAVSTPQETLWCQCVEASEGTDQELAECDRRFDPLLKNSYDKTCLGYHVPDDERN